MPWSFQLALTLVSANRSGGNRGRAFAGRAKFKRLRDDSYWLICAKRNEDRIPKATARRRVTFTRVCGPGERAWDYDNRVAAFKPICDSLVRAGLLVDDNDAGVERVYPPDDKSMRHLGPAVRIRIEELDA